MQIDSEKVGDVAVVSLQAEHLDASIAEEFKRDMTPVLEADLESRLRYEPASVCRQRRAGSHAFMPATAERRERRFEVVRAFKDRPLRLRDLANAPDLRYLSHQGRGNPGVCLARIIYAAWTGTEARHQEVTGTEARPLLRCS